MHSDFVSKFFFYLILLLFSPNRKDIKSQFVAKLSIVSMLSLKLFASHANLVYKQNVRRVDYSTNVGGHRFNNRISCSLRL